MGISRSSLAKLDGKDLFYKPAEIWLTIDIQKNGFSARDVGSSENNYYLFKDQDLQLFELPAGISVEQDFNTWLAD